MSQQKTEHSHKIETLMAQPQDQDLDGRATRFDSKLQFNQAIAALDQWAGYKEAGRQVHKATGRQGDKATGQQDPRLQKADGTCKASKKLHPRHTAHA